ncbi:S-adenosylmethionine transporter, partial [Pisolithus croceorrhizus]
RRPSFGQSLIAGGAAGTACRPCFSSPSTPFKTRLQSAQGFVKAGGFGGIYKGVGSVVVGSAPGGQLAPLNHMISASVGEVAACLIRVPTEVIKTRTQTSSYGSSVASSLAAAKLVLRNDGVKGFYRGFGITVMREIPFTLKYRLSLALDSRPLHAAEAAVCGSIAGGVAAALTTPLDVLKTRVLCPEHLWISAGGAVFLGVYEWVIGTLVDN